MPAPRPASFVICPRKRAVRTCRMPWLFKAARAAKIPGWCERGDSNPSGLPHRILSPARLPVPPLSQYCQTIQHPRNGSKGTHLDVRALPAPIDPRLPACSIWLCGAPAPTRTGDLRLRRPTLYPAELRAHLGGSPGLNLLPQSLIRKQFHSPITDPRTRLS